MTTTTNPTTTATTTATDDQAITTWCAQVAASHHTYETCEWMHYETQEIRDRALVEWTIRCLGNTGYSAAEHTRRVVEILAERHNLLAEIDRLTAELESTRVDLRATEQACESLRAKLHPTPATESIELPDPWADRPYVEPAQS